MGGNAADFMSIEKILEAESESSVGGICISIMYRNLKDY